MPAVADRKNKRRATKVAALTAALVVAGGAAFAYWTAGGSGTGSATTGDVAGITVNQNDWAPGDNLYPGGPAVPLAGTFTNTNSGPIYVAGVTLSISSVAQAPGASGPCDANDYTITQPNDVDAEVVTGSTWSGATIKMKNTSSNQDGCKNATVNLHYEVN